MERIRREKGKKERKYDKENKEAEDLHRLTKQAKERDCTIETLALLNQLELIMNPTTIESTLRNDLIIHRPRIVAKAISTGIMNLCMSIYVDSRHRIQTFNEASAKSRSYKNST